MIKVKLQNYKIVEAISNNNPKNLNEISARSSLRISKSMEIMKSKNVCNIQKGGERFQQMLNKDWERYQSYFQLKKVKQEKDIEKKEKRNVLYQKFEENLLKVEKQTK